MATIPPKGEGRFPTTEWTLVARLKNEDTAVSARAIDELCRIYHYPLYCQMRRRGLDHHDAEDALHEFLIKLMRLDTFGIADAEKGRLRVLLITALQRFLANWHRDHHDERARAAARLQNAPFLDGARDRYEQEEENNEAHHESPDLLYDRQWAQALMRQVFERLREQYAARGKAKFFETLLPVLQSGGSLAGHDSSQIAAALGMRPGALRTALMRLLRDYQEALRLEVLQTVQDRDQARAELAVLMAAFQAK